MAMLRPMVMRMAIITFLRPVMMQSFCIISKLHQKKIIIKQQRNVNVLLSATVADEKQMAMLWHVHACCTCRLTVKTHVRYAHGQARYYLRRLTKPFSCVRRTCTLGGLISELISTLGRLGAEWLKEKERRTETLYVLQAIRYTYNIHVNVCI